MKKIFFIIGLFVSFVASSQTWIPVNQRQRFTIGLGLPVKTFTPVLGQDSAQIWINPSDSTIKFTYKGGIQTLSSGSFKASADSFFVTGFSTRGRLKQLTDSMSGTLLKYTDTSSLLGNYSRYGWVVKYTDTSSMLSNRLKYSDTAYLLSNYLRKTTLILPAEGGTGYTSLSSLAGDAAFTGAFQAKATNLTSLSALSYASTSFVKMTAAGTFALDVNTYLTTSSASSTYLPLSGGTLSGALSGTSASFSVGSATAGTFTNTGGNTLILNKGSGPNILLNATSQSWSLSGEGVAFKLYDITASTTPLSIAYSTGAATFSSSVTASSFSGSANITGGTGLSGALTGTLNNISIGSTQYTPLVGSNDDRYMKVTLYDGGSNGTRGGFSYGYDAQGNFGGLTLLAQRSFSFQSGSNGSVFIVNGTYNTVFTTLPIWSAITTSGIPFASINDAYNASASPGGQIFNSAIHEYALGYGSTPNVNGTAVLKWNTSGNVTVAGTFGMKGYTVGTLPAGVTGAWAYVTDASGPTYGATVVGGGSVVTPVFYNGSNWTCR